MVIQRQGPVRARSCFRRPPARVLALLAGVPLAVLAAGARAQSRDGTAPSLPGVTVTADAPAAVTEGSGAYTNDQTSAATGLALSPRETPQSLTVITRQRIDDQKLDSVTGVLRNTAGISSASNDGEGGRIAFYSRGFEITNFQYDGVPTTPLPDVFLPGEGVLDTAFYDRVEVVRGATGLLSGTGNPSASINLVRKRPGRVFAAQGTLGAGSWDDYRGMADLSTPLAADGRVRARLVGAYQDKGSFMDHASLRRRSFYAIVEADLGPDTTVALGYEYQNIRPQGLTWGGQPLFYRDGARAHWARHTNLAARWNRWDSTLGTGFASLEQRLAGDWTLKAAFSQKRADSDSQFFSGLGYPDRTSGQGLLPVALDGQLRTRQNSLDLMASGPFRLLGREHELVLGATGSRRRSDYRDTGFLFLSDPIGPLADWRGDYPKPDFGAAPHSPTDTRVRQAGFYTAARLSLADPLTLIVGGRVNNYDLTQNTPQRHFSYRKHGKVIPYAGLVVDLDDTYSAYASYTGIFNPQAARDRDGNVLAPTEGRNKEVGLKASYLDGRLDASLALFEARQDNVAQIDTGHLLPDGTQAYVAANGTRSRGIDLQLQGALASGWNLYAGLSHFTASDGDGGRLNSQVPRTTATLYTTYRLPGAWHRLTLGGGVNWQSRFYQTALGPQGQVEVGQRAYALASLMARYEATDRATVSAVVNNLFDKRYYTMAGFYNQYLYGEPRSVMVTLAYRYD